MPTVSPRVSRTMRATRTPEGAFTNGWRAKPIGEDLGSLEPLEEAPAVPARLGTILLRARGPAA